DERRAQKGGVDIRPRLDPQPGGGQFRQGLRPPHARTGFDQRVAPEPAHHGDGPDGEVPLVHTRAATEGLTTTAPPGRLRRSPRAGRPAGGSAAARAGPAAPPEGRPAPPAASRSPRPRGPGGVPRREPDARPWPARTTPASPARSGPPPPPVRPAAGWRIRRRPRRGGGRRRRRRPEEACGS